ncbi:hypothetical protein HDU80_003501 [Chytriomyces hyalinus]|nr:hypothetical protein HDU80_003501 [Chytriomyces hyalinus]
MVSDLPDRGILGDDSDDEEEGLGEAIEEELLSEIDSISSKLSDIGRTTVDANSSPLQKQTALGDESVDSGVATPAEGSSGTSSVQ